MKQEFVYPLFKVGEEVILCSKRFPEYNGEYIVSEIINPHGIFICQFTGEYVKSEGNYYSYKLHGLIIRDDDGYEVFWKQSSLRKKYPPADKEFTEYLKKVLTWENKFFMMDTSKQEKEKQQ